MILTFYFIFSGLHNHNLTQQQGLKISLVQIEAHGELYTVKKSLPLAFPKDTLFINAINKF
jgi:hypothetical protein